MKRGQFFFITGGARSGKSRHAEDLALSLGPPVTYVATAEALDEEMEARIREHRRRRPEDWSTIEEPRAVAEVIEKIGDRGGAIIIDCLTLLISNLLFQHTAGQQDSERLQKQALTEIERLAAAAWSCRAHVILVSNELGMGLVPSYPQGRLFRDVAGWANQILAAKADKAYFLVAGHVLDLKALNSQVNFREW